MNRWPDRRELAADAGGRCRAAQRDTGGERADDRGEIGGVGEQGEHERERERDGDERARERELRSTTWKILGPIPGPDADREHQERDRDHDDLHDVDARRRTPR